jgi:hypothetical protein
VNWTGEHIIKWIRKIGSEDTKSAPKSSVVDDLICYGDNIHKRLTWSDSCSSWFKRDTVHGRVTAAFAGTPLLFRALVSEIRAEDFDIAYRTSNWWSFIGNGFTQLELDPANDLG